MRAQTSCAGTWKYGREEGEEGMTLARADHWPACCALVNGFMLGPAVASRDVCSAVHVRGDHRNFITRREIVGECPAACAAWRECILATHTALGGGSRRANLVHEMICPSETLRGRSLAHGAVRSAERGRLHATANRAEHQRNAL